MYLHLHFQARDHRGLDGGQPHRDGRPAPLAEAQRRTAKRDLVVPRGTSLGAWGRRLRDAVAGKRPGRIATVSPGLNRPAQARMVMGTFATWSIITLISGLTVLTRAMGPQCSPLWVCHCH